MNRPCPMCGHDLDDDHPVDDDGNPYCSQSVNAPPSCRACVAQLDHLLRMVFS